MKRRNAFTLIEVLVVIALLGLLAAMIFPVLSQAKVPAKGTVCLSNLHSIDLGISLYAQDADSKYPYAVDPGNRYSAIEPLKQELPLVADVLAPYLKSRDVWRCPLDVGTPKPTAWSDEPIIDMLPETSPSVFAKYGSSYGYDSRLGTDGVTHPAILWDPNGGGEHGPSEVPVSMDLFSGWHGSSNDRRVNVLYADGHVHTARWPDYVQSGGWIVR